MPVLEGMILSFCNERCTDNLAILKRGDLRIRFKGPRNVQNPNDCTWATSSVRSRCNKMGLHLHKTKSFRKDLTIHIKVSCH